MPPPLTAHIQARGARHIWMTAGAQRTLGCTMGNGEQPGLQQESLKEKKTLRKKKKSWFIGTCNKRSCCPPES